MQRLNRRKPLPIQNADRISPRNRPVVVDFNATWCGPCNKFKPIFHKIASEYGGKADFVSADTDVCTNLAKEYNASSIPATAIVFPDSYDKKPVTYTGYMDESQLRSFLDGNI